MWPDSPFAVPTSSFAKPVPLVTIDPDVDPNWQVCFRKEWLPYIIGSLQQLVLQTTWKTNDKDALNLVQARAQQLISAFIVGCPIELPADGCVHYPMSASIVTWFPLDPYGHPDETPEGYSGPPFTVLPYDDPILHYKKGDVIVTGFPQPDSGITTVPAFGIDVVGTGQIEIHFVNALNGGICAVTVDNDILNTEYVELQADITSIPPESVEQVIHEIELTTSGAHHIDCRFIPQFDDSATLPIHFGGAIRSVVLCGFDDMALSIRQAPDNECLVQYSYDGATWFTLVDLSAIEFRIQDGILQQRCNGGDWSDLGNVVGPAGSNGTNGTNGTNGREIQLQTSGGYIQWRYVGDVAWTNLVSLASITGPAGSNGTNGREIQLQTSGGYIQWRYVGDAAWTNLVSLASITGPAGSNGTNGTNGKQVEFQNNGTYIQWRYVGDATWINLVALADIKGDTGYSEPAPDGAANDDRICGMAEYLTGWVKDIHDDSLTKISAAVSASAAVIALASAPLGAFFAGAAIAIVVKSALDIGISTINAENDLDFWETTKCNLYCILKRRNTLDFTEDVRTEWYDSIFGANELGFRFAQAAIGGVLLPEFRRRAAYGAEQSGFCVDCECAVEIPITYNTSPLGQTAATGPATCTDGGTITITSDAGLAYQGGNIKFIDFSVPYGCHAEIVALSGATLFNRTPSNNIPKYYKNLAGQITGALNINQGGTLIQVGENYDLINWSFNSATVFTATVRLTKL